jgi:hypothetical protein
MPVLATQAPSPHPRQRWRDCLIMNCGDHVDALLEHLGGLRIVIREVLQHAVQVLPKQAVDVLLVLLYALDAAPSL